MTAVTLHAPFAGWVAPLDEVPDPVFAERMMGDGLAIEPLEGGLKAPCDAEVISVSPTAHAVTLRLANGAEIIIHIGVDTVALKGEGFTAHVAAGQSVRQGDPLIDIDLDAVARRANSLITPLILSGDSFQFELLAIDRAVTVGEPLARIRGEGLKTTPSAAPDNLASADIMIPMAHGLHARPAARIGATLKPFQAEVEVAAKGKTANARSTVALMSLGLGQGDNATITARGDDARAALVAVIDLIEGEQEEPAEPKPATTAGPAPSSDTILRGVCASPGLAIGPVARFTLPDIVVAKESAGVFAERSALGSALRTVAEGLAGNGATEDSVAAAHRALLDDPELLRIAGERIDAGRSAGFAWREAIEETAEALRATGDTLLIERIDDLRDIERQVLAQLAGTEAATMPDLPDSAILIADTLLPSQFMTLDTDRLAGLCTARGGPTSHVAIMAASAGVPMLVAVGDAVLHISDGTRVVLDAVGGTIDTAPSPSALAVAESRARADRQRRAADAAAASEDCRMADDTRIEIFANLASGAEAARAVAAGAEGCGLLRTEFLFHDRPAAPSEEEQRAAYADIAVALGGRPLIVRTLDAGADKPLPYLPHPAEDNPALGLRGVRMSLSRPDLLHMQLRALVRASEAGDIRIMVPMIVDAGELRQVRSALEIAARELGAKAPPLGIMVETPAAALLADSLASDADFLSIGTNDLSQYALAADRGNPAVAERIDALHPAVLRLIAAACEGARRHGKWIGVCGGVASDPHASAILIGLGVRELSATPAAIPALKAAVRRLRLEDCRTLAKRALATDGAEAVRALAAEALSPEMRGAA